LPLGEESKNVGAALLGLPKIFKKFVKRAGPKKYLLNVRKERLLPNS